MKSFMFRAILCMTTCQLHHLHVSEIPSRTSNDHAVIVAFKWTEWWHQLSFEVAWGSNSWNLQGLSRPVMALLCFVRLDRPIWFYSFLQENPKISRTAYGCFNLLEPTGYVMHQQFNIQQLYVLPTLYSCVLYLSENKQRLVPLTA